MGIGVVDRIKNVVSQWAKSSIIISDGILMSKNIFARDVIPGVLSSGTQCFAVNTDSRSAKHTVRMLI